MRTWIWLALVACGSSTAGATPPKPATREARAPAASAGPRCSVDATYWTESQPIDPGAPIAVVFGLDGWGGGADRPAIAVWPDGTVLDDGKVGRVPAARAAAIAHDIADRLRDQPPRVSTTDAFDTPSTLIAARDGQRWRVVHVDGLTFRGVRARATVRAVGSRRDRAAPEAVIDAIRALLQLDEVSRPDPYVPAELVLAAQRIAPGTGFAQDWPGAPLEWPRELPAPPAPSGSDGATFDLVVPGKLAGEVDRLASVMFRDRRPVRIRGERWMFYVNEHYRGHDAVDRAIECADTEYVRRWNAEHGNEF
jgi:hypothetical protein